MRSVHAVVFSFVLAPALALPAAAQTVQFGSIDPACTHEGAPCQADAAFTPGFGGYRAGGSVSWSYHFSPPADPVTSIYMDVLVVGLFGSYPGNIDPNAGQLGNYFALNGTPFFAFTQNTDGRDLYSIQLPGLVAGLNTFSVVAYSSSQGPRHEGWAGVDYAVLTINTAAAAPTVPEPMTMILLGTGLAGIGVLRARRRSTG